MTVNRAPLESAPAPQPAFHPTSLPARAQQPGATQATQRFGRLPLAFIPNQGQSDSAVQFQVNGMGGTLFFTAGEVVLALPGDDRGPRTKHEAPALSRSKGRRTEAAAPATADRRGPPAVARIQFDHANQAPTIEPLTQLPGMVNYFIGNDPTDWHTDIPTYAGIVYKQLYPGIDLRYDGTGGQLKATYLVAPGADPTQIRWRYHGAQEVQIDATGNLQVSIPQPTGPVSATASVSQTAALVGTPRAYLPLVSSATPQRTLTEQTPVAWQEVNGQRVPVTTRYQLAADGSVQFDLGSYDAIQPLVIDPTLVYSTYLGGNEGDEIDSVAADAQGNVYVTGGTYSDPFPTTSGAYQRACKGDYQGDCYWDAFVVKLNTGGSVVYSTYLSGVGYDQGHSIAVDASGNALIVGEAGDDFPLQQAIRTNNANSTDVFVSLLNDTGSSLLFSTYLGGSQYDYGLGIARDANSGIYITGATKSSDFQPVPASNAPQPTHANSSYEDAFIVKLLWSNNILSPVYSTYLGGSVGNTISYDYGSGIAVDASGAAYVTGLTQSTDFPVQNGFQISKGGGLYDAFITKVNSSGTQWVFSSYLGGSESEYGYDVEVDANGTAYLVGSTDSTNYATTPDAIQPTCRGTPCKDMYLTKVTWDGAVSHISYSTFFGGSSYDSASSIARDIVGSLYITGESRSTDFPSMQAIQSGLGGRTCGSIPCRDAFIVVLDNEGKQVQFSTLFGGSGEDEGFGIAVDGSSNIYVGGYTTSTNLPLAGNKPAAISGEGFIAKISGTILPPDQNRTPEYCPCASAQPSVGQPINSRTGNYWTETTDLRVETPGVPLAWSRVYASQAITDTSGELGPGWQHPFAARIITPTLEPDRVILLSGGNNRLRYADNGDGTYTAWAGVYSTLTRSGTTLIQTERDQTTRTYL